VRELIVSAYRAFRSEPDGFMAAEPLARGVWNIRVPATTQQAVPDVVIAPVVGFERAWHRLGYGVGFSTRILAKMKNSPLKLAVGYRLERYSPHRGGSLLTDGRA
jgi:5-formyltetrahydrofolate cyclo-ligase